ncbi:hypothetical protein diail_8607 [Diaporthe ilicicola]|nr:hypothetical protein diail_8607 [Diaporthe ilicicola]
MPQLAETSMDKPLPGPTPVNKALQLRKTSSSQDVQTSPKSTSNRSRESGKAGCRGSRRTLECEIRGSRDLRHRSSTSTVSSAASKSFVTSTSGAGTIVGISKDVSVNRSVGSGQSDILEESRPDQPDRTPLSTISNRVSWNVHARKSKAVPQPGQENTTPAKTQHLNRGAATHMCTPTPTLSDKHEAHTTPSPVLPQLRKLQRQIQCLKDENDDLRAVKTTHLAAIDGLRAQIRAKDAEKVRLVEQLRAEAATREAVAALKEEKWTLLGRISELEQQQKQQQAAVREEAASLAGSLSCAGSVRSIAPPSRRDSEAGRFSSAGYDTAGSLYSDRNGGLHHAASCSSLASGAGGGSFVRRRRGASVAASAVTAASLAEEELDILSDQLAAHQERYSFEQRRTAAQLAALEDDLAAARRQRDTAEGRERELEARLAAQQVALVRQDHHHQQAPIPDLPVLTYAKVGAVWFDTVVSAFKYWGLFEFISQPDESLFAGADPDREGRRLRAVVLLKRAMDDDILDDVMYLQNQKSISAPPVAAGSCIHKIPPEIESPYFLFHTAAILKRTVPNSLMDFGWLDRINDSDFEGIEGFASLVNILNRRHSQLYGTSPDHYDALIPKIQESMSRRFPDLDNSLMDPGSAPKKRWHLALWMSRMVKRRQGWIAGIGES